MSRSKKKYPKICGPESGVYFKRVANRKVRSRAKKDILRLSRADNLENLVMPDIDEVSDTFDIDYCIETDPKDIPKALRK